MTDTERQRTEDYLFELLEYNRNSPKPITDVVGQINFADPRVIERFRTLLTHCNDHTVVQNCGGVVYRIAEFDVDIFSDFTDAVIRINFGITQLVPYIIAVEAVAKQQNNNRLYRKMIDTLPRLVSKFIAYIHTLYKKAEWITDPKEEKNARKRIENKERFARLLIDCIERLWARTRCRKITLLRVVKSALKLSNLEVANSCYALLATIGVSERTKKKLIRRHIPPMFYFDWELKEQPIKYILAGIAAPGLIKLIGTVTVLPPSMALFLANIANTGSKEPAALAKEVIAKRHDALRPFYTREFLHGEKVVIKSLRRDLLAGLTCLPWVPNELEDTLRTFAFLEVLPEDCRALAITALSKVKNLSPKGQAALTMIMLGNDQKTRAAAQAASRNQVDNNRPMKLLLAA